MDAVEISVLVFIRQQTQQEEILTQLLDSIKSLHFHQWRCDITIAMDYSFTKCLSIYNVSRSYYEGLQQQVRHSSSSVKRQLHHIGFMINCKIKGLFSQDPSDFLSSYIV